MSKKVIVTGCSGQDGALLCNYLIKNTDVQVYGVVRRSAKPDYSNIPQDVLDNPRFNFIFGELGDSQSMDLLVKNIQPDYFINLAANSFVGTSWDMPEQVFDINTIGVIRQLEAIRKHKPSCRYYQAGSSEEFGDVTYSPQDENHPLRPRSPYGASKAAARHAVKIYRDSYNLYAIQPWLFNHESCERGQDFVTQKIANGVARIKRELDAGECPTPIELGNLDAKRDWSHAADFVKAIWMMLNQELYNSDLVMKDHLAPEYRAKLYDLPLEKCLSPYIKEYVLSSGETHSVREFVELAFKAAHITGYWHNRTSDPTQERFYMDNEEAENRAEYEGDSSILRNECSLVKINPKFYRPAEVELLLGDSTLIRKDLGWKPEYTFETLVSQMVGCAILRQK